MVWQANEHAPHEETNSPVFPKPHSKDSNLASILGCHVPPSSESTGRLHLPDTRHRAQEARASRYVSISTIHSIPPVGAELPRDQGETDILRTELIAYFRDTSGSTDYGLRLGREQDSRLISATNTTTVNGEASRAKVSEAPKVQALSNATIAGRK